MLNDEQLKSLLEVAEKATPGPFEVFPIKTVAGDTAGFTWGKYLSDNRDADHFWSSELVSFNDATYYSTFDPTTCAELVREVLRLREQVADIKHVGSVMKGAKTWQTKKP